MKMNELEKKGKLIRQQYNLADENFYSYWFEHSFDSGIFAQLIDENGDIYTDFSNSPVNAVPFEGSFHNDEHHKFRRKSRSFSPDMHKVLSHEKVKKEFAEFVSKIKNSESGDVSYIQQQDGRRGAFCVYGIYLGKIYDSDIYLRLTSPLERTDTTRKVLQTQLIIASVLSVLLALLIAYFIAKRVSKPIERISAGAKQLACGNYNVEFEKGSYCEIEELAETLNYTATELSKTEELRRDLISNVSHDLRTPLTIINSYAELIRDISGNNEEKRIKHSNIIIEEANNLSLLVNDMLDLSKIQSGTVKMELNKFEFETIVESTVRRFEYYKENHGIVFEKNYKYKGKVSGDEHRIEQVIYNLVANAVNYTGDDKRVIISLTESGDNVRFSVRDTGCGIEQDEFDLVWDKYYRSSETHKRAKIGTGIGLSIVKNILLVHEAPFGVDSKKNEGSEFWFELKKA